MSRRQAQTAAVASVIAVAAAAAVVTPAWESTRRDIAAPAPAKHPRYATQSRSREAVRAAHLRRTANQLMDTSAEACERFSTVTWATKLGVRPDPVAVAWTLARRYYGRAERNAAYEGCLGTLRDR
jgi:uncharacterized glyoxalase superfamily protein PhnB